jgi:hypothetical protein
VTSNSFPIMRPLGDADGVYLVEDSGDGVVLGTVNRARDALWSWYPDEPYSDRTDLPYDLPTAEDAARVLWRYCNEPDPAAK